MLQGKSIAFIGILFLLLVGCAAPIELTPTPTPYPSIHPTLPASTKISASATTPDGTFWYSFDEFDGIGGVSMYAQHQGLFHKSIDGIMTHFDITQTIKVLKVAPDGSLYIGAGCGVLRYRANQLETLANSSCDRSDFKGLMFPFDIAFANEGDVWVGGIWELAHYDGSKWIEYDAKARRLLVAPDGSIWADGLPDTPGTDCCFYHLTNGSIVTYTHDASLPVQIDLLRQIYDLRK